MAIRATEVVVLFKVINQASSNLSRLSRDFGKVGAAARAAQAVDASRMRVQKQNLNLMQAQSRLTQQAIRGTRDLKQVESELFANQTQRWLARQRLGKAGGDAWKEFTANRAIEQSYMRQEILQTRLKLLRVSSVAEQELLNAQLAIQEAQQAHLNAELEQQLVMQRQIAAAGRYAPVGAITAHAGRAAAFAGGIATLGFTLASSRFAEFDRLATRAATQSASTTKQIHIDAAALEKDIMRLMKVYPAGADEMAKASYDIYSSLDVSYGNGIKLLEMFNQAAVAGGVDLTTATEASITALENFDQRLADTGQLSQQTAFVMDYMFRIVKEGRMSFDDMQQIMSQVAPAAAAANQGIEDVAASVVILTRKLGVAKAGASLARLLEIAGSKDFIRGMRKANLAIDDGTGKLLDWETVLEQIAKLEPNRYNDLIRVITAFGRGKGIGREGTVQARRGLTELIKFAKERHNVNKQLVGDAGEMQRAYEALSATPGVQFQVAINQLKLIALEIGQAALPVIIDFFKWIARLGEKLSNFNNATGGAVYKFAALAGVVLLVVGPIAILVGSILSLIGRFKALKVVVGPALMRALATLGAFLSLVASEGIVAASSLIKLGGVIAVLRKMAARAIIFTVVWNIVKGEDIDQIWKDSFWSDVKRGDIVGGLLRQAGLTDLGNKVSEFHDKHFFGGALANKNESIKRAMRMMGLNTDSIKAAHDSWFQLEVADRKRIYAKFKERGLGQELLHRISVDTLKQAFKPIGEAKSPIEKWFDNLLKGVDDAKTRTQLKAFAHKYFKDLEDITSKYGDSDVKKLQDWVDRRNDVIKQATEQAVNTLDQAANALLNKYNSIRDANQSALGTLFEGPWMTSETMTIAKEWGVKPRVDDLIRDMSGQNAAFSKWDKTLTRITKRGAPKAFVDQLRDLGPEALDSIAAIARSSPAKFKELVRVWQRGQNLITGATERGFNDAMAGYKTYGARTIDAIIEGLDNNDQKLLTRFRKLIDDSFSTDYIAKVVGAALKEYEAENPKPKVAPKDQGGPPVTVRRGTTLRNPGTAKFYSRFKLPFHEEGPQFYQQAFKIFRPFAKKGPYMTKLNPQVEKFFKEWVGGRNQWKKKLPFDVNAKIADYDMRGFWLALSKGQYKGWKPGMHFPDKFKTPYDTSFSRESMYASKDNPFVWNKKGQLVDRRNGKVVFDPAPERSTQGRTASTGTVQTGAGKGAPRKAGGDTINNYEYNYYNLYANPRENPHDFLRRAAWTMKKSKK